MTQPPVRYSQGSLIQEMERLALGTKSTRHDIIQKLYDRKYVEGNDLIPTASGVAVAEALIKHAQIVTDPKMTAHLKGIWTILPTERASWPRSWRNPRTCCRTSWMH